MFTLLDHAEDPVFCAALGKYLVDGIVVLYGMSSVAVHLEVCKQLAKFS